MSRQPSAAANKTASAATVTGMAEQNERTTNVGTWLMLAAGAIAIVVGFQWYNAHQEADRLFAGPVNNGPYQAALGVCAALLIAGAVLHRKT